jgi:hypothetical protein
VRCFYSPGYFLPLPAGHPFPMVKFPMAREMLISGGIIEENDIFEIEPAARECRVGAVRSW